jgi:V8-like Glu-specific endopeptidase
MKTVFLAFVVILTNYFCFSQTSSSKNDPRIEDFEDDCGPFSQLPYVIKVLDSTANSYPFNCLVHIETNRKYGVARVAKWKADWGTGTFISDDCILTAHHVLLYPTWLKEIKLANPHPATKEDKWVTFNENDFQLNFYKPYRSQGNYEAISNDIAILKITNKEKLKQIYKANIPCTKINDSTEVQQFHLSGYPSYFAASKGHYDTLITRTASNKDVNITTDSNFIFYPLFSCSGDSGAPIWVVKNSTAYVVGVHHGGYDDTHNEAVRLDDDMLRWINRIIGDKE